MSRSKDAPCSRYPEMSGREGISDDTTALKCVYLVTAHRTRKGMLGDELEACTKRN